MICLSCAIFPTLLFNHSTRLRAPVYDSVDSITPPWGGFSKLDCSTTEVPGNERNVFGKPSATCFAPPAFFGIDTIPTVEISSMEKSAQVCVVYTVVHASYSAIELVLAANPEKANLQESQGMLHVAVFA